MLRFCFPEEADFGKQVVQPVLQLEVQPVPASPRGTRRKKDEPIIPRPLPDVQDSSEKETALLRTWPGCMLRVADVWLVCS